MSSSSKKSDADKPGAGVGTKVVKAYIGYCPDLKIYRYEVEPMGSEERGIAERFTDDELLARVASLEGGDQKLRDYLLTITGLAKAKPHMRVEIDVQSMG